MANKGTGQTILLYLCSVGIGAFGMMGLLSFLSWLAISTFHEYSRYPNLYPFSVIFGLICLAVFITLIVLWFMGLFKRTRKLLTAGISVLFVLAGSAAGYFAFSMLGVISDVFLG